jgi:hypothetical protein
MKARKIAENGKEGKKDEGKIMNNAEVGGQMAEISFARNRPVRRV